MKINYVRLILALLRMVPKLRKLYKESNADGELDMDEVIAIGKLVVETVSPHVRIKDG